MTENWEQFGFVMANLTTLSWDQVKFLETASRDLLTDVPPGVYTEQGETLARDYLMDAGPVDGSNATKLYPDVLTAVNTFSPVQLHALHIVCQTIVEEYSNRIRDSFSYRLLFPQHRLEDYPGLDPIDRQIRNLMAQMERIEHEEPPKALEYLDQAIQLAKKDGRPHTYLEAIRLDITGGDRSGLCFAYYEDLAYYRERGDLMKSYHVLNFLAYECRQQGKQRKAVFFAIQARDTLTTIIESERPIAKHPDFEAYERIMLRIRRAILNYDIRDKKFR